MPHAAAPAADCPIHPHPPPPPAPHPAPSPLQLSRCCSCCRPRRCASSCRARCRRLPTCSRRACRARGEFWPQATDSRGCRAHLTNPAMRFGYQCLALLMHASHMPVWTSACLNTRGRHVASDWPFAHPASARILPLCPLPLPSDSARAVLVSMVKQLGADYLPFVCEVLQSGERAAGQHGLSHPGWRGLACRDKVPHARLAWLSALKPAARALITRPCLPAAALPAPCSVPPQGLHCSCPGLHGACGGGGGGGCRRARLS